MAATKKLGSVMGLLASESAIYGLIMVSGLVLIVADKAETTWEIVVKVAVTVGVFWVAHVFAGTVAHLSDEIDPGVPAAGHVRSALRNSLEHSWGMLLAAAVPIIPLVLGTLEVVDDQVAIWGTMWTVVIVLGVVGFAKIAQWSDLLWLRLAGAGVTSGLGVVLILAKTLVH